MRLPEEDQILEEPCLRKWQAAHVALALLSCGSDYESMKTPFEALSLAISTVILCAADPNAVLRTAQQLVAMKQSMIDINPCEICQTVLGVELSAEGLSECIKQDRDQ